MAEEAIENLHQDHSEISEAVGSQSNQPIFTTSNEIESSLSGSFLSHHSIIPPSPLIASESIISAFPSINNEFPLTMPVLNLENYNFEMFSTSASSLSEPESFATTSSSASSAVSDFGTSNGELSFQEKQQPFHIASIASNWVLCSQMKSKLWNENLSDNSSDSDSNLESGLPTNTPVTLLNQQWRRKQRQNLKISLQSSSKQKISFNTYCTICEEKFNIETEDFEEGCLFLLFVMDKT